MVGVDGSEHALAAVRWAAREASLRHAAVRIVTAWEVPDYALGGVAPDLLESLEVGAVAAAATAREAVRASAPDVEVQTSIVEGQAARALVEAARGAELLVVGSRGLGGFRSLLLGSVGQQCAHHARCPVVIVRAERPRG